MEVWLRWSEFYGAKIKNIYQHNLFQKKFIENQRIYAELNPIPTYNSSQYPIRLSLHPINRAASIGFRDRIIVIYWKYEHITYNSGKSGSQAFILNRATAT